MANQERRHQEEPGQEIVVKSRELLFALRTGRTPSGASSIAEIVRVNPGLLPMLEKVVYQDPSLLKDTVKTDIRVNTIRREYPTVVAHFSHEGVMDRTLSDFDSVKQRLQDQKTLLANLPIPVEISDAELVLRMMLSDSTSGSIDDYRNVLESHRLFGQMAGRLMDLGYPDMSHEEMERFTQVGQKLLKAKRAFEIVPELGDLEREKRGEGDFEGIMAIIRFRGSVVAALTQSGNIEDRERAKRLRSSVDEWIEQLAVDYPERRQELERLGVPDHGEKSRWTEEPGEPYFTQAEIQDFMHSGNG